MMFPSAQTSQEIRPEQVGRNSMIIVGALMFGLLNFASIALFVGQYAKPSGPVLLSYIGLGAAAVMMVLRFVVPGLITGAATRRTEDQTAESYRQKLATAYQSRTVIGNALLEGAGFLNCVTYILTGSLLNLGAVAVLLTLMAITFPSQTHFDNWADQIQRDTL